MKMPDDETRNWKEKGLALVVPAVGLLVLAGVAVSTYLTWSAIPLHSNPQNVPSLTSGPPATRRVNPYDGYALLHVESGLSPNV